jgi:hypothetical protein
LIGLFPDRAAKVLDHDPHPWSKTPGKPPGKYGIGVMLAGTKALQMGAFCVLWCISVRLKIVVSAVRVRLSPLHFPLQSSGFR